MTARELIEEGVDLSRGAAAVAKILGVSKSTSFTPTEFEQVTGTDALPDPLLVNKPARKRRSDAGKPKAKKDAIISADPHALRAAINEYLVAGLVAHDAIEKRDQAEKALNDLLGLKEKL